MRSTILCYDLRRPIAHRGSWIGYCCITCMSACLYVRGTRRKENENLAKTKKQSIYSMSRVMYRMSSCHVMSCPPVDVVKRALLALIFKFENLLRRSGRQFYAGTQYNIFLTSVIAAKGYLSSTTPRKHYVVSVTNSKKKSSSQVLLLGQSCAC
jgi:hypothetical protein